MKLMIGVLGAVLLLLAAFTWWALESGGVAIVETRAPDGTTRSTHVWFVESDGELWLEADTPENSWYLDVQRDPWVSFSAPGRSGGYLASPIEEPSARERIRGLLRAKYGVRDWWVGVLIDTSRSIAVRLDAPELGAEGRR